MAWALKINGEERRFDHSLTVREMLILLGLDPAKIAVERNLAIVPRSSYGDIRLGDGDRIEIYRPLAEDPKIARRKRVRSSRQ